VALWQAKAGLIVPVNGLPNARKGLSRPVGSSGLDHIQNAANCLFVVRPAPRLSKLSQQSTTGMLSNHIAMRTSHQGGVKALIGTGFFEKTIHMNPRFMTKGIPTHEGLVLRNHETG
jgi:hypothetical protein